MSGPVCALPSAVAELLGALEERGHSAFAVGRCVPSLLAGAACPDFEIATSASSEALLALLPKAVPVEARRVLVPCAAGPVDLLAGEGDLELHLARRDFTRHAMALDARGALVDPHGGREDLRAARLRCPGRASERLAEDPLRAVRAVRLVAELGLEPDADVVEALPEHARQATARPAVMLRAELHRILLGPHVLRGLELLRSSGIERLLAPGVGDDAAAVVAALPPRLALRLAGWLRGARAVRTLRRLREPRERVAAVERLLQLHPVDAVPSPVRRLLRRPARFAADLFALRAAEIAARGENESTRRELERLRSDLDEARRAARSVPALALDGRAVMEILGCAPGPEVGRALQHLRKAVEADPACNTAEALRERLIAWRRNGATHQEDEPCRSRASE